MSFNASFFDFNDLNAKNLDVFACPDSHVPLVRSGKMLISPETGRKFLIADGIPNFLRYDCIEDDATLEKLNLLNSLACEIGWRAALNIVYEDRKDIIEYVTNEKRASFLDLLPITSDSAVLEIGPSLGQQTSILGLRANSVHALEIIPGQALFAAQRCFQECVHNVFFACGGDDGKLPYSNSSFDFVILNLVFEWCVARDVRQKPGAIQRRILNEIHRILRSSGSLFLATKNRYDLKLLLGRRDLHAHGIPFGNALPYWIMRLILVAKKQGREKGLLYSYRGLKRLLTTSGYKINQTYWAVPDMRFPKYYVPTDAKSISYIRRSQNQGWGRTKFARQISQIIPAKLVKYVAPGLVFLARKG